MEGRPCNSYGAAGTSAWMSDSELLNIRAPHVSRGRDRPKEIRFKGVSDYYNKKQKRTKVNSNSDLGGAPKKKKKMIRCGKCKLLGHNSKQCRNMLFDTSELPEF